MLWFFDVSAPAMVWTCWPGSANLLISDRVLLHFCYYAPSLQGRRRGGDAGLNKNNDDVHVFLY